MPAATMQVFETRKALISHLDEVRRAGRTIGLVPTMGNLHAGHLALVAEARRQCGCVVATIFVNPTQFGPREDYGRYPRSEDEDREKLRAAGCDALFMPAVNEMYPAGFDSHTVVSVPELSELHCGASRPGHFNGVATVVCKLFNLVRPDVAFFGEKDYQQLLIIRKMTRDLCMPVAIAGVPIQREPGGLAMSSRNRYLSKKEQHRAMELYRTLSFARDRIQSGERNYNDLEAVARKRLEDAKLRVDYFTVCHAGTLLPATEADTRLVILGAVFAGDTRLIDNVTVNLEQ